MPALALNPVNILILLGSLQGVILSVLLWVHPRFSRLANFFLGLFIACFALNNFYYWSIDAGLIRAYPLIYFLPLSWNFVIPASFYVYVLLLTRSRPVLHYREYALLAPVLLDVVQELGLKPYFGIAAPYGEGFRAYVEAVYYPREVGAVLYALLLLALSWRQVSRYQRKLRAVHANSESYSLAWLQQLIGAVAVLWVLWALPVTLELAGLQVATLNHYPFWLGATVIIYWIGLAGYRQRSVFIVGEKEFAATREAPALSTETDKYFQRLRELMQHEQRYRDPNLTVGSLAAAVAISPGYLSRIIRSKTEKNFSDFVNDFRVADVKEKLLNPEFSHYDILSIGLEAGFNSKAGFYSNFKKRTGLTPRAFQKAAQQSK